MQLKLYPGVFLVDGCPGCYSVLLHRPGRPLPHDGDRVFPIAERSAAYVAEMYDDLMETYAERRELAMISDPTYAETVVWPPKWWHSLVGKH
ncbi:hypothetical protein [Rhodococcus sp. SJ-3]|uniref:hypothetical protein n=1 Tax=Rhodococcus sp. SJ-3 TaxID=3454628 RepID=UPI003F795210